VQEELEGEKKEDSVQESVKEEQSSKHTEGEAKEGAADLI